MVQQVLNRCFAGLLCIMVLLAIPGCSSSTEAPAFTLENLTGQPVSLSDFIGKPLIINFWQLSCPPCIEELPYFQAVHERGDTGAAILTVAIRDSEAVLNSFMASNTYSFTVLRDVNASVAEKYGIRYTPTTVFIDSKGQIVKFKTGTFHSANELAQAIGKID
jgi:peroxiredoxin